MFIKENVKHPKMGMKYLQGKCKRWCDRHGLLGTHKKTECKMLKVGKKQQDKTTRKKLYGFLF